MRLFLIPLAALLLAGCVIVPLEPFAYAPRPRHIYRAPVYPPYPYRPAPRYYDRGRW